MFLSSWRLKIKKANKWVFSCVCMMVFLVGGCTEQKTDHEQYLEMLQHEIHNRVFARYAVQTMAMQALPAHEEVLWEQYSRLEQFTWPIYLKKGIHYNLDIEERSYDRLRGQVVRFVPTRGYEALTRSMLNSTISYVEILKKLPALAPPEDIEFVQFVIAQEELQITLMQEGLKGNSAAVIEAANDFFHQWLYLSEQAN